MFRIFGVCQEGGDVRRRDAISLLIAKTEIDLAKCISSLLGGIAKIVLALAMLAAVLNGSELWLSPMAWRDLVESIAGHADREVGSLESQIP